MVPVSGRIAHTVLVLLLASCAEPSRLVGIADTATPSTDESIPAGTDLPDNADFLFADTGIVAMGIELDPAAIETLAADPYAYVAGAFIYRDERYDPVGVRLKGSSTYQWLDGKPAWKIRFDEFAPDQRFHGLKRITLDSNYWDASQMAETLAYRTWREADSPAARTGYASVAFNGELYGLYTIVEAMDDDLMDRWWPGSNGGLYEMCRSCDFHLDCSQYPLQDSGENFDPDGLARACAASASGDGDEIRAHWDWGRFLRFQAVEWVVNHPDTYSFNLNNYFIYHDPDTDRITLLPWGADSTFSYAYPPDAEQPCEPGLFSNLQDYPNGYMATWCLSDEECWSGLKAAMLDVADQIETNDLAGYASRNADRIDAAVAAEPRWPWGYETFREQAGCFRTWIENRPAQVRAFVSAF